MKLEHITSKTTETFIEGHGINVAVYPWANLEGCSFLIHANGEHSPLKCAASMRWEEIDVLLAALTAARAE